MKNITLNFLVNVHRFLVFLSTLSLVSCSTLSSTLYHDYSVEGMTKENLKKDNTVLNLKNTLREENLISDSCKNNISCTQAEISSVGVGLISVSDYLCNEHTKSIFGNDAAYNIGFGTATNLFAGAAAVAGSVGAKTLFSSIALFSNAERSLVNETVYKTMISTAITTKIKESRQTAKSVIMTRLIGSNSQNYSIDLVISDVLDYHYKCSFMNGLELALKEGTQQSSKDRRINELRETLSRLQLQLDIRTKEINTLSDAAKKEDPVLSGYKIRIDAINEQLKVLETSN